MSTQAPLQVIVDAGELFGHPKVVGRDISFCTASPEDTFKAFVEDTPNPNEFDEIVGEVSGEKWTDMQLMFGARLDFPRTYAANEYARAVLAAVGGIERVEVTLVAPVLPQRITAVAAQAVSEYCGIPVLGVGFVTERDRALGSKRLGYDAENVSAFSKRGGAKMAFVGRAAGLEMQAAAREGQPLSDSILTQASDVCITSALHVLGTYPNTVSHVFWRMNEKPHGSSWVRYTDAIGYEYHEKRRRQLPIQAVKAALSDVTK